MPEDDLDRIWRLMESIRFCMLSNWNADARSQKDDAIRQYPQVCLAFADPRAQKYVSIYGSAEISSDREKIRDLWSIPTKIWWDNPDDPNIRIIAVTPSHAEYWDTSGNLISGLKVAFSLATGMHVDYGEHKKVDL
jgi:hypothetical protein